MEKIFFVQFQDGKSEKIRYDDEKSTLVKLREVESDILNHYIVEMDFMSFNEPNSKEDIELIRFVKNNEIHEPYPFQTGDRGEKRKKKEVQIASAFKV